MARKSSPNKLQNMLIHKKIKVEGKYIDAILVKLLSKSLILLRARKGFIMCGYLDLKAAQRFNDVAIKIMGVSTIGQAMSAG